MLKEELGGIEWLASCTPRELAAVRKRADIIDVPAGTTLIREGDAPRWFYALISGDVTVQSGDHVVARPRAGDPINEVEVLRNDPSRTSTVTDTDCRLLVMGRREFLGMLDDTPGLARRLLVPHIPTVAAASGRRSTLVPLPAA